MTMGTDETDVLAYELVQTDFDAVERGGLRAAWTDDNTRVIVEDLDTGASQEYDGEDLVRAESDQEVENARNPAG